MVFLELGVLVISAVFWLGLGFEFDLWRADKEEPGDSDDDGGDEYGAGEEDEEWSAFRESRGPPKVQPLDSSLFLLKQPVAAPVQGDEDEKKPVQGKVGDGMVLRVGGVLKCRLCVKTMCLTDETMKSHLLSKVRIITIQFICSIAVLWCIMNELCECGPMMKIISTFIWIMENITMVTIYMKVGNILIFNLHSSRTENG